MLLLSGRISSIIAVCMLSSEFSGFGAYVEYDIVPLNTTVNKIIRTCLTYLMMPSRASVYYAYRKKVGAAGFQTYDLTWLRVALSSF